jgi:hypothetical protein
MNWTATLAPYLAVLLFGVTTLTALGLLAARHTKPARVLFATGVLGAALAVAAALLSFLAPEFRPGTDVPLVVVASLSLSLAGAGQFAAALRGGRAYAAALGCAAASVTLAAFPWLGVLWGPGVPSLGWLGVPFVAAAGLLAAAASVAVALFPGFRPRQPGRRARPVQPEWAGPPDVPEDEHAASPDRPRRARPR